MAVLCLQVVWIFVQWPLETRYFSWAMFHTWTPYKFEVQLGGRRLRPQEFRERYGFRMRFEEARSIAHKVDWLQQYERIYGTEDVAVHLIYTENGHEKEWDWAHRP